MRVVSLLPSATETLVAIGGSSFLVGVSADCVSALEHRSEKDGVAVVTRPLARSGEAAGADQKTRELIDAGAGVEALDRGLLRSLAPDLVILQDACGVCSADAGAVKGALASLDPRPAVLTLNTASVEDMLDGALKIGAAVGLREAAEEAVAGWRDRLHRALDRVTPYAPGPRVAVLEWADPLFVGGHWTAQLVERAGGEHPLNPTRALAGAGAGAGAHGAHRAGGPSREITAEELAGARIEALVVAPCGEPLEGAERAAERLAREPWWGGLPAARAGRVAAVSGKQLSRPGPGLVAAQEWFVWWLGDRSGAAPGGLEWSEPLG